MFCCKEKILSLFRFEGRKHLSIQSKFGNRLSHQQCLITYYKKIKTLWKLFEIIEYIISNSMLPNSICFEG